MRPGTTSAIRFHSSVIIAPQEAGQRGACRSNDWSAAPTFEGPDPRTATRREDDDGRALLDPIKEIDDILVGHADASGGYGLCAIVRPGGSVGAVYSERVS